MAENAIVIDTLAILRRNRKKKKHASNRIDYRHRGGYRVRNCNGQRIDQEHYGVVATRIDAVIGRNHPECLHRIPRHPLLRGFMLLLLFLIVLLVVVFGLGFALNPWLWLLAIVVIFFIIWERGIL